jgi:hypothetical protein
MVVRVVYVKELPAKKVRLKVLNAGHKVRRKLASNLQRS